MTGRPSSYTPEIAAEICEQIASGQSLRSICAGEGKPNKTTVLRWLAEREDFRTQYARARDEQADFYAEEIIEIVDTEDDPAKARVRMDARRWIASKLAPKKYGDKLTQEHTGKDGGPLTVTWLPPQ